MDVIDRINVLLNENNMTGTELTESIGLKSNGVYSQWNTRRTSPTNRNLLKIAEKLGTSYEYLKTGEQNKNPQPKAGGEHNLDLSEDEAAILALYRSRPPELRRAAKAVLESAPPHGIIQDDGEEE